MQQGPDFYQDPDEIRSALRSGRQTPWTPSAPDAADYAGFDDDVGQFEQQLLGSLAQRPARRTMLPEQPRTSVPQPFMVQEPPQGLDTEIAKYHATTYGSSPYALQEQHMQFDSDLTEFEQSMRMETPAKNRSSRQVSPGFSGTPIYKPAQTAPRTSLRPRSKPVASEEAIQRKLNASVSAIDDPDDEERAAKSEIVKLSKEADVLRASIAEREFLTDALEEVRVAPPGVGRRQRVRVTNDPQHSLGTSQPVTEDTQSRIRNATSVDGPNLDEASFDVDEAAGVGVGEVSGNESDQVPYKPYTPGFAADDDDGLESFPVFNDSRRCCIN